MLLYIYVVFDKNYYEIVEIHIFFPYSRVFFFFFIHFHFYENQYMSKQFKENVENGNIYVDVPFLLNFLSWGL